MMICSISLRLRLVDFTHGPQPRLQHDIAPWLESLHRDTRGTGSRDGVFYCAPDYAERI